MSYVYLIHDQNLFKIGKCIDIASRQKTYRTHNPTHTWITEIEVLNMVATENFLLEYLRQHYKQYQGTREWFYAENPLSKKEFHRLVQEFEQMNLQTQEDLSIEQYVFVSVRDYIKDIPLESLLYAQKDSNNQEWVEHLDIVLTECIEYLKITVHNTKSLLLLLLFCDSEYSLKDLISSLPSRCGELKRDWDFHNLPARYLLDNPVAKIY